MSKYEPTNYMKRTILFNRQLEESYQSLRKSHNDMVFGELTPEEQAEWDSLSTELESENKTERSDRKLAQDVINGGSL